jgi:tripartite-type tricarboxylate transporter receptor subunit TctC
MEMKPTTRRGILLAASCLAALPLRAQPAWPNKPITLIVPFAPGGIADITARTVAQAMGASLGQTMIVDNRPSAGSIVASQAVAKAAPDGYTLLLMSNANAVSASLFKKLPFDVVKDFAPIGSLGFFDLAICVARESRFKSLRELMAHGKANPGKLTLATIAVGSSQNLAAELFKSRTGIDAVVVPYKGSPAVITALRAGEVDAVFEILGPTLPQITGGALRALAVTGSQRNAALPEVPTAIEQGVAGYDVESWNALAAPAGTPPAVIERLNRAAREALALSEVKKRLLELGVRSQAGTPAQLQALLGAEIKRWREVIATAKIEPQ